MVKSQVGPAKLRRGFSTLIQGAGSLFCTQCCFERDCVNMLVVTRCVIYLSCPLSWFFFNILIKRWKSEPSIIIFISSVWKLKTKGQVTGVGVGMWAQIPPPAFQNSTVLFSDLEDKWTKTSPPPAFWSWIFHLV